MTYRAPVAELAFLLKHVVGYVPLADTPKFAEADLATVSAVLTEAGRLSEDVLYPLRREGDLNPPRLESDGVRTTPGFVEAYRAIAEGGWTGISASPDYGGMGLPETVAAAVHEMMSSACIALQLNPLLTHGQIAALTHHADEPVRNAVLPHLVSGKWAGTMNLTEPQAGSDVGALQTRAEPDEDGTYRLTGTKIFISWGDGDLTENICHLVLARLPDAPPGSAGISLFLVPKFMPNSDGTLGARNALRAVSLEDKLGFHGCPTAVMAYEGATGWRIGPPHSGLAAMFTMMNNARLLTGIQGIGLAEAALQSAQAYSADRKQGRTGGPNGTIDEHPDVRRMLATMRAEVTAARATALSCAVAIDMAHATKDDAWAARAAFLTPIAKTFGAETGHWTAQEAIQVHGGMGFIEETGIAQLARDARVIAIYEGTSGIQAADLVTRKLADGGDAAHALLDEVEAGAEAARTATPDMARAVWSAAESLREATEWMLASERATRLAGSLPYLRAWSRVLGAHFHLRAALAEGAESPRTALCRVYVTRLLPQHTALLAEAQAGIDDLLAMNTEATAP